MFFTKFLFRRASQAVQDFATEKAKEFIHPEGQATPAAGSAVPPVEPPPVFNSPGQMMGDFRSEPHFEKGYQDGFTYHSKEFFQDAIAATTAYYNTIIDYQIDEVKRETLELLKALTGVGPNTEHEQLLSLELQHYRDRLAELLVERAKKHATDETSGCYNPIREYTRGFNAGMLKFIQTRGGK